MKPNTSNDIMSTVINNSGQLREYLSKLMEFTNDVEWIVSRYETASLELEGKLRKESREKLKQYQRNEMYGF